MEMHDDVLGKGFKALDMVQPDDYEGEVKSVLVFRPSEKASKKAILYVHGYIDYFFQTELADHFNKWGFNFYAVDLRKYGRSLMPHQKPNFTRNVKEYFEDLESAISHIKQDGNEEMLLMGHSTGGLITSLFMDKQKDNYIKALLLNSPFFDLNIPSSARKLLPVFMWLGKIFENMKLNILPQNYPQSLHKDYKGEWDFNVAWKPIENYPMYFTWLRAIRKAHIELHSGLDISVPVLVMHSDKSFKKSKWADDIRISDGVLDVKHIAKFADVIGKDITKVEVTDAIHDMVLSQKLVRTKVYSEIDNWLKLKELL